MGSSKPVRPPWWLKPANKVFIQMSRLGMSFGGESPVVLTVAGRKSGRERSTPRNSRRWPAVARYFDWMEFNSLE
jgi:hypothetical protein